VNIGPHIEAEKKVRDLFATLENLGKIPNEDFAKQIDEFIATADAVCMKRLEKRRLE